MYVALRSRIRFQFFLNSCFQKALSKLLLSGFILPRDKAMLSDGPDPSPGVTSVEHFVRTSLIQVRCVMHADSNILQFDIEQVLLRMAVLTCADSREGLSDRSFCGGR